jgi:hypothetical protein
MEVKAPTRISCGQIASLPIKSLQVALGCITHSRRMAMSLGKDTVSVTVYLDCETVARIDEWAGKLGHTRSRFTRYMIEEAIVDNGLCLNIITSRPSLAIMNAVRNMCGKPPIGPVESGGELLGKGIVPAA